jgi:preprotein translocase subunit YajC
VSPILIIVVLFGLMYFLMIRPQRAKAQQQQRLLSSVAPGDEILTVGGIYGIVQEIEPDEDGGDLVVEIADGIHVRVARKAVALVVKPEEDDDEEADEEDGDDGAAAGEVEGEAEADASVSAAEPPEGVEEVNDEEETVNPGAAEPTASPERS